MSDERLRLDVLLHRLCLARSRTEAKGACDAGMVLVDGAVAKPSQEVSAGQAVTLRFATRTLEVRVERIPPKSTSKQVARTMYEVVREERAPFP